jgi:hypothetical protein
VFGENVINDSSESGWFNPTLYRWLFAFAAAYNFSFGIWAGLFPQSFFTLFELEQPRYPSLWACLGMVVGVYGFAYAYAAVLPGHGRPFIAIGLLGKVLGPIGWLGTVAAGELPPRTYFLILFNDLIWWFPFLYYLLRDLPQRRLLIAWASVAVHVLASLALLAAAAGTEIEPDMELRRNWVQGHAALWAATWLLWTLASLSLIAFALVWTTFLERGAARYWAVLGFAVMLLGLPFDLAGESLNLMWPTRPGVSVADFAWAARLYALLSAATANGLYCVGGIILSVVSWQLSWLRGWLGAMGSLMWTVGLLLTVMAILDHGPGMIVTGGGVMLLYIPWASLVGWRLRRIEPAKSTSSPAGPAGSGPL